MRVVRIVDCHSRSLLSEEHSDTPTNALIRSSNKCGLPREIKHRLPLEHRFAGIPVQGVRSLRDSRATAQPNQIVGYVNEL